MPKIKNKVKNILIFQESIYFFKKYCKILTSKFDLDKKNVQVCQKYNIPII